MKTEKKTISLHDFVEAFKSAEHPAGVYPALDELRGRGIALGYMTMHRWLTREARPSATWTVILRGAGIDVTYLSAAK